MTDEEIKVAKILRDCQQMLKSGGNNDEIRRQLTLAKHILFTQTLIKHEEVYCPVCKRYLPVMAGVVTHDNVPHPEDFVPEGEE